MRHNLSFTLSLLYVARAVEVYSERCGRQQLTAQCAPIVLFDSSMSALPIIASQQRPSVGLFIHQQGT